MKIAVAIRRVLAFDGSSLARTVWIQRIKRTE